MASAASAGQGKDQRWNILYESYKSLHERNVTIFGDPQANLTRNFEKLLPPNVRLPSEDTIAKQVSKTAARVLTPSQFQQLIDFLNDPGPNDKTKESLQQQVEQRVKDFYSQEVNLSGETTDRLAKPNGSPDAVLGLILHCQSNDYEVAAAFWDTANASTNLLEIKGMNTKIFLVMTGTGAFSQPFAMIMVALQTNSVHSFQRFTTTCLLTCYA